MKNKIRKTRNLISGFLRNKVERTSLYETSIAIAYLCLLAKENKYDPMTAFEIEKFIKFESDERIRNFLLKYLESFKSEDIYPIMRLSIEELRDYLLYSESDQFESSETPKSIIHLVNRILDISEGDELVEIFSGKASFPVELSLFNRNIKYLGYDNNETSVIISNIKLKLLDEKTISGRVEYKDLVFDSFTSKIKKAFMHPPFGQRIEDQETLANLKKKSPIYHGLSTTDSLAWVQIISLYNNLAEDGRAVILVSANPLTRQRDKIFREYFINKSILEAIIALPENLLLDSGIGTYLLVLSKNNEKTMMVDATMVFEKERRFNFLSNNNINEILNALNSETKISKIVTKAEISKNDYNLIPSRYTALRQFENGVKFESFATIKRGSPLTARKLDEMAVEKSNYQYLYLADINDGIINQNLKYIKEIPERLEKYLLNNNNLVLSKMGDPFKVALFKQRNTKVLVSGNLYIIEVDESKVDPYYIQAFLQSEKGQELMKIFSFGLVKTISISDLLKLEIPLPALAEQRRIGEDFKKELEKLEELNKELEKIKEKIQKFI